MEPWRVAMMGAAVVLLGADIVMFRLAYRRQPDLRPVVVTALVTVIAAAALLFVLALRG